MKKIIAALAAVAVTSFAETNTWGIASTSAQFSARAEHQVVVFNNKLWIIGGRTATGPVNDVWFSSDTTNWSLATFSAGFLPRYSHRCTVFNGKIYLAGGKTATGSTNDVWYTSDGITWALATGGAAFSSRLGHLLTSIPGLMLLSGGTNESSTCINSYTSADGITWTLTNNIFTMLWSYQPVVEWRGSFWTHGGFGYMPTNMVFYAPLTNISLGQFSTVSLDSACRHQMGVYNDSLFIIGGLGMSGYRNDVLISGNGTNWTLYNGTFSARAGHQVASFNGKLCLIGGEVAAGQYKNDVYIYPPDYANQNQLSSNAIATMASLPPETRQAVGDLLNTGSSNDINTVKRVDALLQETQTRPSASVSTPSTANAVVLPKQGTTVTAIKLYDAKGRYIKDIPINNASGVVWDKSGVPTGLYYILVTCSDGTSTKTPITVVKRR